MGFLLKKAYKKLLKTKPEVFGYYEEFKKLNEEYCYKHKLATRFYLLKLLLTKKNVYEIKNPRNTIKPSKDYLSRQNDFDIKKIEDLITKKNNDNSNPSELVKNLQEYDLISFDVFDTCIFRPFEKPTDLFYYISKKLDIENFYSLRSEAEKLARLKTSKKNHEIDIQDIYNELPSETSNIINFQKEIEFEKELCYANKFMLNAFKALKQSGKKIIAISDMYLPKNVIEEILNKNGFSGFDKIFVSNEFKQGKSNGKLFKIAKREYKNIKNCIHIGDNFVADIKGAKKGGFKSFYYSR